MPSLRDEITKTLVRLTGRGDVARENPAEVQLADPREGTQIANYRILRRLGEGGMGQVYLALDTRLGRHVALKFLPNELTSDPEFLERFQQEAHTASALNHPNIVTIYDFTEFAGESVLVTEFIQGANLRTILDHGDLAVETSLQIGVQIASALSAAHEAGIVHRDLKPSNIMVRPDGYLKVIDFGLAKFTARSPHGSSAELTRRGSVLGTVHYMSPEQARGETVDSRTDIWSLGVVLYELLTGRKPFQGKTESHVVVSILDHTPAPIIPAGDVTPALVAVIEQALQKPSDKRYQTAHQMLQALQRVQRQSFFSSEVKPVPVRSGGKRTLTVAASLVLCVGVLVCCWVFWGRDRLLGPNWFQVADSRTLTFSGDVTRSAISPDGRYLAYVAGEVTRQILHLVDIPSGNDQPISGNSVEYTGLSFSPDSQTLFFVLNDEGEVGTLFSVPVRNGGREPSSLILQHIDGPIAFSPNGHDFAFTRVIRQSDRSSNEIWLGNDSNSRNPQRIVGLSGTQINWQISWLSSAEIAAVTYPVRLNAPTQAVVSIFDRSGRLLKTYMPRNIRSLFLPVAVDKGSLLLFTGFPQGAQQKHLAQLYLPTGEFHLTTTDVVGFDSITATADSQTLAAVRMDQRSSVWVADATDLKNPVKITRDSEYVPQMAWIDTDSPKGEELVFPSGRSGNVNLARLRSDGTVRPVGQTETCVQAFPNAVPSTGLVVYAANCAHGNDDFNIWTVNTRTGARKQLTSGSTYDYRPDISADGKWVIYDSWSSNVVSVWRLPVSGGMPSRLSSAQTRKPFVSPDGSKIVCQFREANQPWVISVLKLEDGTVLRRFPELPSRDTSTVRWSPDGKALDYVKQGRGYSIWRKPLDRGAPIQLTTVSDDPISFFAWNGNGSKLAYSVSRQQSDAVLFYRGDAKR